MRADGLLAAGLLAAGLLAAGLLAAGLLAAGLLAACSDDDGVSRPPLEPERCGLDAYAWLPPKDTGAVVGWEEDVLSPMAASGVDTLLSSYTDAFSPVPYGARVFRIRYTTQDRGRAVEATALVGLPYLPDPDRASEPRPVVAWTHGTTGFMGECAPSYTGEGDIFGVYLLASLGYVVAAPDYIGLDAGADFSAPPPVRHAYLNIEQTAIGTLDAVHATVALFGGPGSVAPEPVDTPVIPDTDQVVFWGASQGGHAALAADRLAPYYSPRLGVRATVAMVPPTDLVGLADYAVSAPNPATVAVAAMLVANHSFYEGDAPFDDLLSTEAPASMAERLPDVLYAGCDAGDLFEDATRLEQVFDPGLLAEVQADGWGAASPWRCYLEENSFSTTSIPRLRDTPTLVVLSEDDDLVYTPVIRDDFDRLCDQGYRLEYLECADAGHAEGAGWSLPEQVAWVEARLAGEPIDPQRLCQRRPPERCSGQPE